MECEGFGIFLVYKEFTKNDDGNEKLSRYLVPEFNA